jgi:ubiquitin-conjugating enzyme E2 C
MAHESSKVFKRLSREIKILKGDHTTQAEGIKIFASSKSGGDDYLWHALIKGPNETLYEDLTFWVEIKFPIDYPRSSMEMRFLTPCAHPNVMLTTGEICSDIFHRGAGLASGGWSPMMTTYTMLVAVRNLLHDPNPNSPLNGTFAQEYEAAVACKEPEKKAARMRKLRETIVTTRARSAVAWLPSETDDVFSSEKFVIADMEIEFDLDSSSRETKDASPRKKRPRPQETAESQDS